MLDEAAPTPDTTPTPDKGRSRRGGGDNAVGGHGSEWHGPAVLESHLVAVSASIALLAGAIGLLVAMAFDASRDAIQVVDDWWYDRMLAIEAGWLVTMTQPLDFLGSTYFTLPLRVAVSVWLGIRRRWYRLAGWLSAMVVSEVAIWVLKPAYGRVRPPGALVETTAAAFPSGHAIATSVTAIALVVVLVRPGPHRREWENLAGAVAFVMAMSRTYLRAHWLSDVVGGVLIGSATALAAAALVHVWQQRREQTVGQRSGVGEARHPRRVT